MRCAIWTLVVLFLLNGLLSLVTLVVKLLTFFGVVS